MIELKSDTPPKTTPRGVPEGSLFYNLFFRVLNGKATRSQAIKCQCLDCMGLDRQGISECGDRKCPLWKFRPFRKKQAKMEVSNVG